MEILKDFWDFVWPHWPAIMFIIILSVVAQTLKTQLFTKSLASRNAVIFWLRRIFPLVLVALGIAMGCIWPGEASPGVVETSHKCLYFSGCSCVSIVGFNAFKQWVKKKYDVELLSEKN